MNDISSTMNVFIKLQLFTAYELYSHHWWTYGKEMRVHVFNFMYSGLLELLGPDSKWKIDLRWNLINVEYNHNTNVFIRQALCGQSTESECFILMHTFL